MIDPILGMVGAQSPIEQPPVDDGRAFRPRLIGRCMADVEPTTVQWLWPGKIPLGRLTVLAGDGGLGKSFLSMAIAATLSRGAAWPDQPDSATEPGCTVLLNAEDDASDTIRPRLDAADADCSRIHIIDGIQRNERDDIGFFSLIEDLRALEDKITETGAKLCIIDPIGSYLDGTDSHRDAAVRSVLGPLAALASRTECACLAIMHLNKSNTRSVAHRVTGSVGFTNAARMAWIVGQHPEIDNRRVMLPFKFNIVAEATGLAFEILDGCVHWLPGAVDIDPESVIATDTGDRSAINEAEDWLLSILCRGEMSVPELRRAAEADCHSWRTIERAKKRLNVISQREGYGKSGRFVWKLPDESESDHTPPSESWRPMDNGPKNADSAIHRQQKTGGVCGDPSTNGKLF